METQELREMMLKELPKLLQKDSAFQSAVLDIARQHFAEKLETDHHFGQFDRAMEKNTLVIEKLEQRLDQKIVEDHKRFEGVEKLSEGLVKQFEGVEKLFEGLVKQFEGLVKQFEGLEKLFEKLEQRLDQKIAEDRKRFEGIDKRFEGLEKRFEKLEQRLDQKIAEDRKQFEGIDKRFEKLEQRLDQKIAEDRKQFEEIEKRFERLEQRLDQKIAEDRIQMSKFDQRLMAMGARWGIDSEAAFRNGLAAILTEIPELEVIHVDERDTEGTVFGHPEEIELDIIVKNGLLIIVELKSATDKSDVYIFEKKARFYEQKQGRKASRRMIISPIVKESAKPVAQNLGIEIYTYAQEINL
jgi:hypothetical protein